MTGKFYRIGHTTIIMGKATKHSADKGTAAYFGRGGKQRFKRLSSAYGFQHLHLAGFVLLAALLVGVVFWLPNMVAPVDPATLVEPEKTEPKVEAPADSPWMDAQLAKQRREAQEVLSQILSIQGKLEKKKIELWANQAFHHALDTAAAGDEAYRSREFDKAQSSYRDSLKQFKKLQDSVEDVYRRQMSRGSKGIEQNDPQEAKGGFQLALYLKPESLDAQQGLKRAEVLEQVMALVEQGRRAMKTGDFTQAKQQFTKAVKLDNLSGPAKMALAKAEQAIRDDNFTQAMSQGYHALNQGEFPEAIKAFTAAVKIRPKAEDAKQALTQAKNGDLQTQVSSQLKAAQQAESREQWTQALNHYKQMLALDGSLMNARIGTIRTKARAQLDSRLQSALDNPERLTSPKVFSQTGRLLADARKINTPGPRLNDQIARLDKLLFDVQQPISVRFRSNNQTKVTLYKVGELGNFSAKTMDLKPGKYTLIGTRTGYRDVRREFTLMPSDTDTIIVVQCEEKITNG